MIKNILIFGAIIKYSRLVVIPSISIKTNNKRSWCEGISKISASCYITMSRNEEMAVSFKTKASWIFVRIFLFIKTSMLFYIINSKPHLPSHTSFVLQVAINELLLWKASELSVKKFAWSLKTCYCWKSPTRSAFSLIFYWPYNSLSSPIYVCVWNTFVNCLNYWNKWRRDWLTNVS